MTAGSDLVFDHLSHNHIEPRAEYQNIFRCPFSPQWPVLRRKIVVCSWRRSFCGLYPPIEAMKVDFCLLRIRVLSSLCDRCEEGWSFFLPSFANWSAISLPAVPVWAGIHCRTTFVDLANSLMLSISLFCESSGQGLQCWKGVWEKDWFWGFSFPQFQTLCSIVECQEFRFVVGAQTSTWFWQRNRRQTWSLDENASPSISYGIFCWSISVEVSPGCCRVVFVYLLHGQSLQLNVTLVFFVQLCQGCWSWSLKASVFGARCLGSVFRIILACLSECQFVSFDVVWPMLCVILFVGWCI